MKYYEAYNEVRTKVPKQSYKEDYDAILAMTFDNAPNVIYEEIEFEYEYGSNEFTPIPKVRVDNIVNYTSSMVVDADDFKTFIFMPDFPNLKQGMKFKWGKNYWLVISTNVYEGLANSAEVRRCNNVLRYFDEYGNKIYEPCIIDTTLRFTKNVETPPITIGSNEEKIWCQRNERTALIKPNDKFLFGMPNQRICFRVYGAGTKNVLNTETMNDLSPSLTEIYIHHYQYNKELDDLVEGFANAYTYKFSVDINDAPTAYKIGDEGTLSATVYKGNNTFATNISWCSSNEKAIIIDNNGNYKAIGIGQAQITAYMTENKSITKSIDVKIEETISEDVYDIVISPDIDYILQGETVSFQAYLYKNGTKQEDAFVIEDVSVDVPRANYSISILNGNEFKIENKTKYMKKPVLVRCTSGEHQKVISVLLRGLY